MKNSALKVIESAARLLGVVGFIVLVASPTGAELGDYGIGGMLLRAAIGAAAMFTSGQMMCRIDRRRCKK